MDIKISRSELFASRVCKELIIEESNISKQNIDTKNSYQEESKKLSEELEKKMHKTNNISTALNTTSTLLGVGTTLAMGLAMSGIGGVVALLVGVVDTALTAVNGVVRISYHVHNIKVAETKKEMSIKMSEEKYLQDKNGVCDNQIKSTYQVLSDVNRVFFQLIKNFTKTVTKN